MSAPREPLRRVVVAGAGQVGILAAIAVRRALPLCEVVVIETAADRAAFADYATTALPFTNRLHDRLGIDEHRLVREAGASHRLVTRLFGWTDDAAGTAVPYGVEADPAARNAFAREWGGAARMAAGERPVGSLAEILSREGRFAVPGEGMTGPLATLDYALRWHQPSYRAILIGEAQRLGVRHVQGAIDDVSLGEGGVQSISTAGETIAADLFLDCKGPRADLLSRLPGYSTEDWSQFLPVREVLVGRPAQPALSLEDRIALVPQGWITQEAGRDGVKVSLGLGPATTQEAALAALAQFGCEPLVTLPVQPSRAAEAWIANVVAIGDAFARFEPLGALNLDLAHRQIDLLLELLPGRQIEPLERAEFNRRSALMGDGVRDTLSAFYAAPGVADVFGAVALSPIIARMVDQLARRGRMPFREESPLLGAEFRQLLAALGYPSGVTPQSIAASDDAAPPSPRADIGQLVAQIPPYAQWLGLVVNASR